jgi:hypothetical protein
MLGGAILFEVQKCRCGDLGKLQLSQVFQDRGAEQVGWDEFYLSITRISRPATEKPESEKIRAIFLCAPEMNLQAEMDISASNLSFSTLLHL